MASCSFIPAREITSASTPFASMVFAHSRSTCTVLPSALGLPLSKITFAIS
jgi:hypothetical protein